MEDYSAGIEAFKQQFNLDDPLNEVAPEEEDYSAGIEAFRQQFNLDTPEVSEEVIPEVVPPELAPEEVETLSYNYGTEPIPSIPDLLPKGLPPPDTTEIIPQPGLKSALEWTTPKTEIIDSPEISFDPDQHVFSGVGDIGPSFKGGSLRLMGNVTNLMGLYEKAHREKPELASQSRFPAITGMGGGFGAAMATMAETPELTDKNIEQSKKNEAAFLAKGAELLKMSSDLGRPLTFEEMEWRTTFGDYLVGLVGQAGPTMLAGMVSMGTASPLLLEAELNAELKEIPNLSSERQLRLAQAGGLIAGALEMAGLGVMALGVPKTLLAKIGAKRLLPKIEKFASKSAAHRFATTLTGRATVGAVAESLTEGGQEETLLTFEDIAKEETGAKPTPPEIKAFRRKEALAGGFFAGGPTRVALGSAGDAASKVKELSEPYLPEDALVNPFAKSFERELLDAIETGIVPGEAPESSVLEAESTPLPEVSPTEVQGTPTEIDVKEEPAEKPAPPKDVRGFAGWLGNNMDDLENYLEGEDTTFEGWLKEKSKDSSEEVKKFVESFTPEVMDKFDEEGGTLEDWINKQATEFATRFSAVAKKPAKKKKVEAEPPKIEPPKTVPPGERKFKPLVDEQGKPLPQFVIKAMTVPDPKGLDRLSFNLDEKADKKKVAELHKRGLINEQLSNFPTLTDKGKELAQQIKMNQELVEEGLPMEDYTPKKGRKIFTKGIRWGISSTKDNEWDGSPVYTDGHLILKGTLSEQELKAVDPEKSFTKSSTGKEVNFSPIFSQAKKITKETPPADPIAFSKDSAWNKDEKMYVHFMPTDEDYLRGIQKPSTITINAKFYDYIKQKYPDAKFIVNTERTPVSIYSGKEIVGMVMPVVSTEVKRDMPGIEAILEKHKGQKKLKVKPEEKPEKKPKVAPKGKKKKVETPKPPVVEPPVETPEMAEPKTISSSPNSREEVERVVGGKVSPEDLDKMFEPDVWEGLEEGKPTRLKVFHGEGKRAQYAEGVEGAALGDGRYSALKESDAKDFGDVTPLTIELKNPAVLESDEDLVKLFDEAIPSENSERIPLLKKAREKIASKGHDGVIINVPKMADVDSKGRSAKRLREIFDVSQVVEFKKPDAESTLDEYTIEGDLAYSQDGSMIVPATNVSKVKRIPPAETKTKTKTEPEPETVESVEPSLERDPKRQSTQSIRELVYTDMAAAVFPLASTLSIDEKVGILRQFSPKRLEKEFRKMVEEKYGFKWVKRTTEGIDITLDNMMDAYTNIEGMAAVLGLPLKAIGLKGNLGLQTEPIAPPVRGTQTNAYYHPGGKFISIHGKNRTFAHEWMHALDFYILERMGEGRGRGMSGRLRGKKQKDFDDNIIEPWNADHPASTTERIAFAFGDLLNAVFFDDAEIAAEIMQLQEKLSKAVTDAVRIPLENEIDKLRKGMTQKHFEKSDYFQGSLSQEWKKKPYFTQPTELLARAFEAYVAHMVELQEQTAEYPGNEYIAMPDWAYSAKMLHNPQITHSMEMVYPKDGDRTKIFEAFDVLFDALKQDHFHGEAAVATPSKVTEISNLHEIDTQDQRLFSKDSALESHRQLEGAKAEFKRQTERVEKIDPFRERGKPERAWIGFENNIANQGLASKTGSLLNMLRRYKDNKEVTFALTEILRRLTDDPGGDKLFIKGSDPFVGTYTEKTRILIRQHLAGFKRLIDKYEAASWTEEQHSDLRLLMTSDPATLSAAEQGKIDKEVTELAGKLRVHLNKIFQYGKDKAGITFLEENAYLPRILDTALLAVEPEKFMDQAEKMFKEVLWDKEFGGPGAFEEQVTSPLKWDLVLELGKKVRSKGMKFRTKDPAFQSQYADFLQLIEELKALDKEMKKHQSGEEEYEGDAELEATKARMEIGAKISDLITENREMLLIAYSDIGTIWAEEGSSDWKRRIDLQQSDDPAYASPFSSDFTKQRKFPKEADTYMAEFYQPAIESIASYTQAVIKKTEFEKRFSSDFIKKHESGEWAKKHATKGRDGSGPPRNYIDFLMDEFIATQIPADDVKFIRYNINAILGRLSHPERSGYRVANKLHSYALMAMLGKAVLTSLPEALMAGIKMQSGMKGLKAVALNLQDLASKIYLSKDAQQAVQLRNQIANIFGIVDASGMADIAIERLGGLMVDDPKTNMRVHRWFKYTGLVGLTNSQRKSVMAIAFQYFKEQAIQYKEPVGKNQAAKVRNGGEARRVFLDFGVPKGKVDEFVDWFVPMMDGKKMPDTSDILDRYGEMGEMQEILNIILHRMVSYSIQDPDSASAPRFAEHPLGRLTYSIMRFSFSVHKNVIKATYRDFKRLGKSEAAEDATTREKIKGISEGKLRQAQLASKLLGPVLSLLIAHTLISTGREFLGNRERWDRWEKEDELPERIIEQGFYRTGLLGAFDPIAQFIRGMRYDWHWSKLTVGATGGWYFDNAKAIADVFMSNENSPNTTTAEAKGLKSAYRLFITPLIIAAITNPGTFGALGPAAPLVAGGAGMVGTSHSAQSWFTSMLLKFLYGDEEEKKRGRKPSGARKGRKGRKGRTGRKKV